MEKRRFASHRYELCGGMIDDKRFNFTMIFDTFFGCLSLGDFKGCWQLINLMYRDSDDEYLEYVVIILRI